MTSGFFITGTDTGVGKTLVAAALLQRHASLGRRVVGMKPVASGSESSVDGLRNDDALLLMKHASVPVPYTLVNPYAFEAPIAPHLAASDANIAIELPHLIEAYRLLARQADVVIVEGAGGWRVPLGPDSYLSDLPEALGLGVILVVGIRLGCLNHALLTSEAILRGGKASLTGWVASGIDPRFSRFDDNVEALRHRLPAPCLGVIPPLASVSVERAAACLSSLA